MFCSATNLPAVLRAWSKAGGDTEAAGQELPSLEMRTMLETVVLMPKGSEGRSSPELPGTRGCFCSPLQPHGRAVLSPLQVPQLCLAGDDARARAVKEDAISS